MNVPITEKAVLELAGRWYTALDEHAPLAEVMGFLVEDGLEMVFPEGGCRGRTGFTDWYKLVTNRFFDEEHTLTGVTTRIDGERATVAVKVNWQATVWEPPAPRSVWHGFDVDQTWEVVAGPRGPLIRSYVVNSLAPMPGSPEQP